MFGLRFRNLIVAVEAAVAVTFPACLSNAQQPLVMKFASLTVNELQDEYMKNFITLKSPATKLADLSGRRLRVLPSESERNGGQSLRSPASNRSDPASYSITAI
jgi:hypothetical protein